MRAPGRCQPLLAQAVCGFAAEFCQEGWQTGIYPDQRTRTLTDSPHMPSRFLLAIWRTLLAESMTEGVKHQNRSRQLDRVISACVLRLSANRQSICRLQELLC